MAEAGIRVTVVCVLAALWLGGCREKAAEGLESVRIDGRWFHLELAADDESRVKGLSGRTHISEDGGMLFVFPDAQVRHFVMRDCLVDIDIIFLDGAGRVVAMHAMKVEEPRGEGEGEVGEPNWAYEERLKRYSSRFRSQFAVELRGGMLEELEVEEGDQVRMDVERLKRLAR